VQWIARKPPKLEMWVRLPPRAYIINPTMLYLQELIKPIRI
jgi:hypothetical protein